MDIAKKLLISNSQILNTLEHYPSNHTALLWSGGRDSTILLYILRRMGLLSEAKILFADSEYEFPEVHNYINSLTGRWNLKVRILRYISPKSQELVIKKAQLSMIKKAFQRDYFSLLLDFKKRENVDIFFSGTRWYEHYHKADKYTEILRGVRFSYPLLHWTEKDVVQFMRGQKIPTLSLYNKGYKHIENVLFSTKNTKL